MRMRTIPAAVLGVLTLAAMGISNPASAASRNAFEDAVVAQAAPPDESDGTETADLPEAPEPAEVPEELPDQEDSAVAGPADPEAADLANPGWRDRTVPGKVFDSAPLADRAVANPADRGWRDRTVPGKVFDSAPLAASDDRGDDNGAEGAGTQQSTTGGTASATGDLPATGGNAISTAMIGGFALAAGGVMYRVGTRRQRA